MMRVKRDFAPFARPTTWQQWYIRYMAHTLIDLTILNLFDEH